MCESTVIIIDNGNEEEFMTDVVKITVRDKSIICMNVSGEIKEATNVSIYQIDSLKHMVIMQRL